MIVDQGTENFESPLDEVLEGLPQEQPPADLKDRCIAALDVRTVRVIWPAWMQVMRNVAAAAAVLILVAGVYNVGVVPAREKARQTSALSDARPMAAAEQPAAEEADQDRPAVDDGEAASSPRLMNRQAADYAEPFASPEPAPSEESEGVVTMYRTASEPSDGIEVVRGGTYYEVTANPEPGVPPRAPGGMPQLGTQATRYSGYDGEQFADMDAETPPPASEFVAGGSLAPGNARVGRSVTEGETEPWRDQSGERQVSYHKEMEIEVADVEKAYSDAGAIVEKRGGYVATDQVRIEQDGTDSARLTIRLPVHAYEDAIEDLRELGEVVRLVGESVDRTHEYYTQGADVRELADREALLMRRYEAETNAQKKRQLLQRISAVRGQMHAQKTLLGRLSEETHWPVLELTLTEAVGPSAWMSRSVENSVNALAWVGATAVIWLPAVVIVTLFWRRRTS